MKKRVLALLLTGTLFVQSGIALAAEISVDDSAEIEEVAEEIVVSDSEDIEEAIELVEEEESADEAQETESEETVAEESVQAITVEDGTIVDSGLCGRADANNVAWTLDNNGTLTLTKVGNGPGLLAHWYINPDCEKLPPWYDKRDSIQRVIIEPGITELGSYAFYNCTNIEKAELPEGLKSLDGSFYNCSSLKSINLPDSARYIKSTFVNCSSLESITIPDGVTLIGNITFSGCSSLTSIIIPDTVQCIEWGAFSGCSSLQSITLPDGITSLDLNVFAGCKSLQRITIPDSVVSIGQAAFTGCSSMESIVLSNQLKSIGSDAFSYCSNLNNIEIPESVDSIESGAFQDSGLVNVSIRGRETIIGSWAFSDCRSLQSITLPEELSSIADKTFCGCYNLKSVKLPDELTSIGESAFYSCRSLEQISIPDNVTKIGEGAFGSCENLKSIKLPNKLNKIEYAVFGHCYNLQNIEIPENVTEISGYAFYICKSLKNTVIPKNVSRIAKTAFACSNSLISLEVDPLNPNFKSIEGIIYNKNGTEIIVYPPGKGEYAIPDEVEDIPDNTFGDNLTDLTVGTGVASVGNQIFDSPSSSSVSSVSTQSAMKIASSSKKVTFKGNAPKFKSNAFKGKTVIAYYPANNSTWTSSVRKNYGGTVTWIATGKIPASSCSMTLSKTIFAYNGKAQKPTVTIKDPNGKTVSSSNYKITYSSGCKNIGEYKVTVKFNGSKYTGSMSKTFTIGPKSTSLKSLTTGTKCFTAKWTKQPTQTSGYQLRYATNSKFTGAKTVTIASNKTTSKKITGLKDATKYYVQIRTYKTVSGQKYCSNWSSAKTVTTKAPVPKATSLTSVTAASKGFTAKWSKQTTQTTGYQLQYSTSSKFTGAKTVWITSNKTTSKKISGLTAKKKYYVRIRTYKTRNGKKYYSSWSKTKTVTTKK